MHCSKWQEQGVQELVDCLHDAGRHCCSSFQGQQYLKNGRWPRRLRQTDAGLSVCDDVLVGMVVRVDDGDRGVHGGCSFVA